jgi:hypothetical protein
MRIDVCIQSGKSSGEEEEAQIYYPTGKVVLGFGSSVPERTSSP